MSSTIGKTFDYLNAAAELSNKLALAIQGFLEARTAIRDYIISSDEKHYQGIEERIAVVLEELVDANTMVVKGDSLDVIDQFLDPIREWDAIARQVHDEFSDYREIVQKKVLINLATLAQSANALLQANISVATSVVLDVQIANVAIISYLLNGEDRIATDAQNAINSAKMKIAEVEQSHEHIIPALQSFIGTLNTHMTDFLDAVDRRKKAYTTFNDRLAPLGEKIETDLEAFYDKIIETQQGINELKIMSQERGKNGPAIH